MRRDTRPRAHGRPGGLNGYIGKGPKFAAAIARSAHRYGEQNERDHAQLVSAIAAPPKACPAENWLTCRRRDAFPTPTELSGGFSSG
jgi:hypothetical protein